MSWFRRPSSTPLWRDEFPVFTADERYVSRRQFTKFLTLTSFGMMVGNLWILAKSTFERPASYPEVPVAAMGEIAVGGVKIFNGMSVEDLMVREKAVVGLVINWTAVEMAGLHVDPLAVRAKFVIDATGHPGEVVQVLQRKNRITLKTPLGNFQGERSLWAEAAEHSTVGNTGEIYPGLYVAGMAVNATMGGYRMGPIFGGMLLSGEKVARTLLTRLQHGGNRGRGNRGRKL